MTPRTATSLATRIARRAALAAAAALALLSPARAAIEDGYLPGGAPVPSTWYEATDAAALQADRDYVSGMRPHHAGALTMSRDYLADPAAGSPVLQDLARGIIRNQAFEIGLLDEVSRNLDQPPMVLTLGLLRVSLRPAATEGLGQMQRFIRSPIPGPLTATGPVTARDVRFAKGMIIHHEAALQMAGAYHADPAARNRFLGLLNTDIIADQSQEIALMRRVIAGYPGDAAAITVDPATIHGMEGMRHGGHGAGAPPATTVADPAEPSRHPRPQPAQPPAHAGHGPGHHMH